jgi:phosphatidylserine/phosphatidylglycerophosphate/cardiolipin synthase-like enzyme
MIQRKPFVVVLILIFSILSIWFIISSLGKTSDSLITMEDRNYYPVLSSAIQEAKSEIRVIMFEAKYYKNYKDSQANDILGGLINASNRGVDVKVILEGGDSFLGGDFSKDSNATCDYLSKNGIEVRFDPENITTHAKLVVIDRNIVIIGSTNWNYYALEKNHEASVLLHSPEAGRDFYSYFERLWKSSNNCKSQ